MPQQSAINVEINGHLYSLKGECSTEDLLKIAQLVNDKIEEIRHDCPQYSATKIAVLAALQIAEEFVKLEEEYQQLLDETELILQG
ncbi:MAG: cell division protein ZapA [Bacillota bacterium]|jgi:cell division protein ZapA